jgi:hypothetical protein
LFCTESIIKNPSNIGAILKIVSHIEQKKKKNILANNNNTDTMIRQVEQTKKKTERQD